MSFRLKCDRRATRRIDGRRPRFGNSILELSLAMPVMLSMGFGLIEFGQYFFIHHAFESATRDAVRVAGQANATQAQVTAVLTNTLAQAKVTYSSSWLTITDLGPS